MGYINRYLLLLVFNVLNVAAFGLIVSVAVVNIVDRQSATNLLIYHGYTGLLSLALLLSELRVPRFLSAQARFLFTYTGRGIVLTYFGCIVYRSKKFNTVACIFVVSLGVLYFVLAWVPFVPLQQGAMYNWNRWCCEGAKQFYGEGKEEEGGRGADQGGRIEHETEEGSSLQPASSHHQHNAAEQSLQEMAWPESLPDMPAKPSPQQSAYSGYRGTTVNESFIYGVTTVTKRPQTTGDEYLDSIVNSSRFARDVMDISDQSIVVRDGSSLARPYSGLASEFNGGSRPASSLSMSAAPMPLHYVAGSPPRIEISSPVPYLVFAPESRESLNDNIMQVTRALNSDTHLV
ncbi:hypothetical protein LPJ53_004881 [Coemansia erecta]|uniref:COPI associated n=1 Tax=Coemansia erecta TaxID=147472 RepID=A0A9W7XXY3_9FUNG|nr:hypothetical protein LPJ53_004881 [Coemansia erecta]